MRSRLGLLASVMLAGLGPSADVTRALPECMPAGADRVETARLRSVAAARRDIWGEQLLASPAGPTLEGAERYLRPLFLAKAAGRTGLTRSGEKLLMSMPRWITRMRAGSIS